MDTNHFAGENIGGLDDVCYPEGRNPHGRKRTFHFDNAPIHNTRTVMGQLEQSGFKRMGHPPDGPVLAPSDFFLSDYMKAQSKGRNFSEEEELLLAFSAPVSEIPSDMVLRVFAGWD
jgi:hypothetical protein